MVIPLSIDLTRSVLMALSQVLEIHTVPNSMEQAAMVEAVMAEASEGRMLPKVYMEASMIRPLRNNLLCPSIICIFMHE